MRYTQLTEQHITDMLAAIGATSINDLFSTIPARLRLHRELAIPKGVSEPQMLADAADLAAANHDASNLACFLGGGSYDHFIPGLVDALAMQSEFLTAYTPYQAEASQGVLQAFFEFQTMICQLTGMEVANSSLYEGATAAAEAVIIALNATGRSRVLVADNVHPDTRRVLATYGEHRGFEVRALACRDGLVDETALKSALGDQTAAVMVQSPNLYGCVERLDRIIPAIQSAGVLAIISTDPLASGLLKPPGAFGADIVVGEGQPLGVPMQYGGPYLGFMATREEHLRRMPGRLVGMTKDREGRRGFCLTLQTREQHIKRERATSNICTNQGLLAMRAAVYMATLGQRGIDEVASQCFDKAHYAAERIASVPGFKLKFAAPFFKEFVVQCDKDVRKVLASCRGKGILAGTALNRIDPQSPSANELKNCFLTAVTEKRTKAEIDALAEALRAS
ncbi:MAG: aminomethyl-transferring glycine dehydrogenase subunit GcvPA [Phycisphaerales bacterium]|nr:aminomethyl-transferring glycine dehydrogenase subunit GcvPA [Phycisphaerales bacterium]